MCKLFLEPKLPFYLACNSSACALLFHVVIHLSWHSSPLRVSVHLCGFHVDGSWSRQGGAVAKIFISLTPLWRLVTLSLFLFGFSLLRCCVLHRGPKTDHSFFVLNTQSGGERTELLCGKMEKWISSRLCENITV